jgi:uncharacterized protein
VILRTHEWPATLDVPALLESGFRPRPFQQFVLKLTARCDLACDYCYVFELADQGWRTRPPRMSPDIVRRAAHRIAEHARAHGLDDVDVVLHGGEPLLYGADGIAYVATTLRAALPTGVQADLRLQTNGVRLDATMLRTLATHEIRVGLSVDGDEAAHDRHRRFADGRGSHDAVLAAVQLLRRQAPDLYGGVLCTIDLRNDPVSVYEAMLALDPPLIDLLLPLATWATPPPGVPRPADSDRPTPYGDWLVAVFDRWYPTAGRGPRIRFFDELLQLVLGGHSRTETLGLSPTAVVVIDTDGSIEQVDTLRVAYDGAASAGLDVDDAALDRAALHPGIVARQLGSGALCATCRDCPVHQVCGGGYYPHRYRLGSGFLNPSVYCHDLQRIIRHVQVRVTQDLSARRTAGGR